MHRIQLSSSTRKLIEKLIEIGQVARHENPRVRGLVVDAQDCALQIQHEIMELLRENEELRAYAPFSME